VKLPVIGSSTVQCDGF